VQEKQPVPYSYHNVIYVAMETYNNHMAENIWKGVDGLANKTGKEEDLKFLGLTAQIEEMNNRSNNSVNNSSSNPSEE